jgi:uncharacterized protein (DUF1800 family)
MTKPTAVPTAVIASQRFGFGPQPGELAAIDSDPKGWLLAQMAQPSALPALLAARPSLSDRLALLQAERQERKARKQDDQPSQGNQKPSGAADPAKAAAGGQLRQVYLADAIARCQVVLASNTPLVERLVQFWSNHFTVSGQRPIVAPLACAFEQAAIRPHVLGRFSDMLLAATRHPAMLLYLDNALSVGPLSRFGAQREKGLNENLARELLELHTLGVDAGYSPADIRNVAKILTGWTVAGLGRGGGQNGQRNNLKRPQAEAAQMVAMADRPADGFRYAAAAHEPGDKTVLGKRYAEAGEAEGRALLLDLARHPATARHVATKFARHFIADEPGDAVIQTLAKTYQNSDGDLGALTRQLIALDAAWQWPAQKIRTPNDWVMAAFRALPIDRDDTGKRCLMALRQLGRLPWMAPSPAGWPDRAADWLSPEALMSRIDWARVAVGRLGPDLRPGDVLAGVLGDTASAETTFQISNAPSRTDALALLLVSPEFMRR